MYPWYDAASTARDIAQAEGGEQGDPLMPQLSRRHLALLAAAATLLPRRTVFAYFDDVDAVRQSERAHAVASAWVVLRA